MSEAVTHESQLGNYLKHRRAKLDPAAFGLPPGRRRTVGLRREEVAQRANISPTWYTWLEQGRGGAPSADVLDRIAGALMLTDVEREHLFLLGLGRPPEARYQKTEGGVTPRLQRVLDALEPSPALIRTATWDVVAWNRTASAVLTDYGALPPGQRNILRIIFLSPGARAAQYNWESVARFVVGAFRVDAARAGAAAEIEPLVDELCRLSPDFKAMWRDNDVRSHGEAVKHIRHPVIGPIAFEYSAFAVDGRPDLSMIVYNPATSADADNIRSLIKPAPDAKATTPARPVRKRARR
jgi:transcriptional regulator with XRE-family HTH domain